jgi:hypothetical protein
MCWWQSKSGGGRYDMERMQEYFDAGEDVKKVQWC